jgi:hypothetical protein
MAAFTHVLGHVTSHCHYKTATTLKLYVHSITQQQTRHLLEKLYQSVPQKVADGLRGLSLLMMSQRLKLA